MWLNKDRTYRSWQAMRQRCFNKNNPSYKYYGGRGITVCNRWNNSFKKFLKDMGKKPDGLTLDRIDNDGNYEPENCKWSTKKEQNNNTRKNRKITIDGVTKNLCQWIDESGLKRSTVIQRYNVYGWNIKKSLGIKE